MAKTTYKNLVTIPGAATDSIVSSPNTGVGGDIVANFKKIADIIHPDSSSSTGCQALNVGCNFNGGPVNATTGVQYHILNNNGHTINSAMAWSGVDEYGLKSGAFMKGVLLDLTSSNTFPSAGYKLIDVPYYGGMIINMQAILVDCYGYVHMCHGTISVYSATGVYGSGIGLVQGTGKVSINPDGDREFGWFECSNGDLYFKLVGQTDASYLQIGMHGTIITGQTDNLNSGQTGSQNMPFFSST